MSIDNKTMVHPDNELLIWKNRIKCQIKERCGKILNGFD